jgi:hypothetical protein
MLTERDRFLDHQPKPLEDITGDGLPNLLVLESDPGGSKPGTPDYWLTVLTMRGRSVEVHPEIHGTGEVLFFDDLNGDSRLEFIAGELDNDKFDGERRIPDNRFVWVFDPKQRRYRKATNVTERTQ